MKSRWVITALTIFLLRAGSPVFGGGWADGRVLRKWTTEDGLPQDSVTAVARSSDGYIWVGTQEGLARFDGVRFESIALVSRSGLRDGSVIALASDHDRLWVLTGHALYRGNRQGFVEVLTEADQSLGRGQTLSVDHTGTVWIGSAEGVFRVEKSVAKADSSGKEWFSSLTEHGEVLCAAGTSVRCRVGGSWHIRKPFPTGEGEDTFTHVAFDSRGTLWAADSSGDIWMSSGTDDLRRLELPERFSGARVGAMLCDEEGSVWVGYLRGGIVRAGAEGGLESWHPGGAWESVQILSLMVEDDDTLWLGTAHQGLVRFFRAPVRVYSETDGLRVASVSCGFEDSRNRQWIGTAGGGLYRFVDGAMIPVSSLKSTHILSLGEDSLGRLWVGTAGDGVFIGGGGAFHSLGETLPIVLSMTRDEAGSLWLGVLQSVYRFDGRSLERVPSLGGMNPTWIGASGDEMWLANGLGGVARWHDGEGTLYGEEDGLPPVAAVTVLPDDRGGVWIGTHMGGLLHFDEGRVISITTAEGLCDDSVFSMIEDDGGRFWMSSNHGVFAVRRDELEKVVAGERKTVDCRLLGVADGLIGRECNGGQQPSAWKDHRGRLWFATAEGAAVVDPAKVVFDPPRLKIESFAVDGRKYEPPGKGLLLDISPGRGELELQFSSIDFDLGDQLHFRFRLSGLDDRWVELDEKDRRIYFASLPPGEYSLQIQNGLRGMSWAKPGLKIAFRLRPAFVDSRWFVILMGLVAAFAVWIANRGRVGILRRRQKRLEELVDLRTRELAEINSTLEQRVDEGIAALRESERMAAYGRLIAGVSHEIRHPLFAIRTVTHLLGRRFGANPSTGEELGILERETDRMHRLVDDLLELGRPHELNIVQCRPFELVAHLVESAGVHEEVGLPVEREVEPDLPAVWADRAAIHQVLLNLVHNAARHAVGASRILVRVRRYDQGNSILISVEDDGAGMSSEVQEQVFEPFFSGAGGTGLGLAIARRLVREQKGRIKVRSRPGEGTVFTVELPSGESE